MTPELQDAYNEWLLKFGYRVIPFKEMRAAKTMLADPITSYEDWKRCLHYLHKLNSYQLKTLEEIKATND